MKTKLITILYASLISCISVFSQNPNTFKSPHNTVSLVSNLAWLKQEKNDNAPLESIVGNGFSGSYSFLYPLRNFYCIGAGVNTGYLTYKIRPTAKEFNINTTASQTLILNIPVYIKRYYPINTKVGFYAKAGASLNLLWSSCLNFGGLVIDGEILYDTPVEIKTIPQPGLIFGLGSTYMLKNCNFISFEVNINKSFINVIDVHYYYYEDIKNDPVRGNFKADGTAIQLALSYNFKQ